MSNVETFAARLTYVRIATAAGDESSGQIVGERVGTVFPFRFLAGNAIPLAYTTAVGGRGGT